MNDSGVHQPVLLAPAIRALRLEGERRQGLYLDATFGRGGHSGAILSRLDTAGRLLALDRDPAARSAAGAGRFADDPRFAFEAANFAAIGAVADRRGMAGRIDGLLFDLGVSSPQLDDPARGFSFRLDGPLDMRMNPAAGIGAADWLAQVSEAELTRVLRDYGEERYARRIARAVLAAQAREPIVTTARLARLVADAVPGREPGKHPATRSFQAIRIAVNDELNALQRALEQAPALLAAHGRLAVISFHSLEDRIVKRFMQRQARGRSLPARLPVTAAEAAAAAGVTLRLVERVLPDDAEIAGNARARSAVLRVAERLP